ncbi:GNAT family N-acetyltransferase [Sodalis sp. dw_96]|uniref:GNAT family N-acetyltransferase n=1 Tax=Sodalis sp. dw_96 TaxID=2719794 RepID=UPI001BD6226B|nr:GNAT family N-acetyltransferase [Sodalis sp. dw_96]
MTVLLRPASAKEIHLLYAQLPEFDTRHSLLEIEMRLQNKPHHLLMAEAAGRPAGFVTGYALDSMQFRGWLGGVLPQYRRRGFASALWTAQEEWAGVRGYSNIIVKTRNRFQGMLLFLITNHYRLTRVDAQDDEEENLIWLAKSL